MTLSIDSYGLPILTWKRSKDGKLTCDDYTITPAGLTSGMDGRKPRKMYNTHVGDIQITMHSDLADAKSIAIHHAYRHTGPDADCQCGVALMIQHHEKKAEA